MRKSDSEDSEENYKPCKYCGVFFHVDFIENHQNWECEKNENILINKERELIKIIDINEIPEYYFHNSCKICNKEFPAQELSKHEETCIKFLSKEILKAKDANKISEKDKIECVFCKFMYPISRIDSHEKFCEPTFSHKESLEECYQKQMDDNDDNNDDNNDNDKFSNSFIDEKTTLLPLHKSSNEYFYVNEFFFASGTKNFEISSIRKVVYPELVSSYEEEKEKVSEKFVKMNLNFPIEEQWLFHYVNNYLYYDENSSIENCLRGFKVDMCKYSFLGKGLYFYSDFKDAICYDNLLKNDDCHSVILSKVLIGHNKEITKEEKNLDANKFKAIDNYSCYDSAFSKIKDKPEGFVVYEDNRAVPCYIIDYVDNSLSSRISKADFEYAEPRKNRKKKKNKRNK